MFSTDDTIVAIATPPGRGGIGVVRISGPQAGAAAVALTGRAHFIPRQATVATVRGPEGRPIDRAVVTVFQAPQSYTGEDVTEISAHGSPVVLEAIVRAALAHGLRLANPGEFTLRAYLHGRIDLVQAEAVADLIDAVTPVQARAASDQLEGTLTRRIRALDDRLFDLIARLEASLDFPEEGYHFAGRDDAAAEIAALAADVEALLADARRGRMLRDGFTVALAGRPNVGKSTLFNRLAGAPRAIVTDVPGTTRDVLTERIDLDGIPVTLVDTAGQRAETADAIEAEGMQRAREVARAADVVVVLIDLSCERRADDDVLLEWTQGLRRVVVGSKSDLPRAWDPGTAGALPVSAETDAGLDALRAAILRAIDAEPLRDRPAIANARHEALLRRVSAALRDGRGAIENGASEEFVLTDLHAARTAFDELVGVRTADDVLAQIFSRFCIGK
jgi:tRNA modification GTPase